MSTNNKGGISSPALTFLNLETDDKRKKTHHEALALILDIFKRNGMHDYNLSHIDDPERNPDIPIMIGKHQYDLSFPKDLDTIVMIEVKILKLPKRIEKDTDHGSRKTKVPTRKG
jgi:hypothetical protein